MKAFLKNYRQSPRKVRLVAGLIKGKDVARAIVELDFLVKRAGDPIKKLLLSAVANASQMGKEKENLFIKEVRVDKGIVMKRIMPAAMGSAHRINKRTSHIILTLGEKGEKMIKNKKEEKKNLKTKEGKKPIKDVLDSNIKKEVKKTAKKEVKKVVKKVVTKKK
ncbi:50S ribosomal protein L22 [Patescibacteria group bacterium]|nr:50S ribosomal protein L22 [Patescibacteria group bacterium]MBU1728221.1 50S ribosomal protein L22 [Patescibacteria group bacterium]